MEQNNDRALPAKVEKRLAELRQMRELSDAEVEYCRATYWHVFADGSEQRHEWHQILINCYERAQERQAA
ncbi:hypothetical protein [Schauerella aestuarii]|uniref:hypothetical protein n=1 Tax=Schauerella aestuarii TaxID=2511204 RepID=UPI00136C7FAA|nr:hypothetical protein [Achromobacter aestuarii]MYZ44195.1 hypothetical protein [Achromobacter aestuarii]